jgi:hypothetical protein
MLPAHIVSALGNRPKGCPPQNELAAISGHRSIGEIGGATWELIERDRPIAEELREVGAQIIGN